MTVFPSQQCLWNENVPHSKYKRFDINISFSDNSYLPDMLKKIYLKFGSSRKPLELPAVEPIRYILFLTSFLVLSVLYLSPRNFF